MPLFDPQPPATAEDWNSAVRDYINAGASADGTGDAAELAAFYGILHRMPADEISRVLDINMTALLYDRALLHHPGPVTRLACRIAILPAWWPAVAAIWVTIIIVMVRTL